jgi:hypothetical protein
MSEQPTASTLEELALRIEVTQAALHCIGRGLSSVMDVLGLDHAVHVRIWTMNGSKWRSVTNEELVTAHLSLVRPTYG